MAGCQNHALHCKEKPPLYRKVNTTAHRVDHRLGRDFRDGRTSLAGSESTRLPMHGKVQRGRDYTPLYRFLLSRVGQPWDETQAEALARLDRAEPIFHLVALHENERQGCVRVGESSYFSGLWVDETGLLQKVDPSLGPDSLTPGCDCCPHTFNGVRFTRRPDGRL